MINPTKLLNYWCGLRRLPEPLYVKMESAQKALKKIKHLENYSLTLYSAAWLRVKFLKTDSIEVYVLNSKVNAFIEKLAEQSKSPTRFIIIAMRCRCF